MADTSAKRGAFVFLLVLTRKNEPQIDGDENRSESLKADDSEWNRNSKRWRRRTETSKNWNLKKTYFFLHESLQVLQISSDLKSPFIPGSSNPLHTHFRRKRSPVYPDGKRLESRSSSAERLRSPEGILKTVFHWMKHIRINNQKYKGRDYNYKSLIFLLLTYKFLSK